MKQRGYSYLVYPLYWQSTNTRKQIFLPQEILQQVATVQPQIWPVILLAAFNIVLSDEVEVWNQKLLDY